MKQIIIINGKGGSGKDTVCDIVKKNYKVIVVSSIDCIKDIAAYGGWDRQKDLKGRKLLSDVKSAFTEYNDLPFKKMMLEIEGFLNAKDYQFLFIHIREPEEIKKLVDKYPNIKTLLVRREELNSPYGNRSDDGVENYNYDFVFDNNGTLEDLEKDFITFFNTNFIKE